MENKTKKVNEKDKALDLLILIERTTGNDFWENWGQYNILEYNKLLKKIQKLLN